MRYLGGKSRTYKQICEFLESVRLDSQRFIEPFCGACWVTQGMSGERFAYDANSSLISMWKSSQLNFDFPEYVTSEEYLRYKRTQDSSDPITAFIGFGYSFGGKWFGGYADIKNPKNHLGNPKKTVLAKSIRMKDVKFESASYDSLHPANCLVYCDPPYAATTGYGAVGKFDSDKFWNVMREWSKHNTVVISEYNAPSDFVCVWSKTTKTELRTTLGRADRTEKLFMHESSAEILL